MTLEVSKLSGWLKAYAACQVQRGHPKLRETRVARRCGTEGRANQQRAQRACVAQLGSVGRRRRRKRTLNICVMPVTLEVSKLSGWLKAYAACRVQRGHPRHMETRGTRRCGTEGGNNQQHTRGVCVCGLARECGQKAQAEAHIKHVDHACDSGGIEAQPLVESSRSLPGPKGASDTWKRVAREDVAQRWEGRISSARGVCVWPSSGVWA